MTLAPITTVFSEIITWIISSMEAVLAVFYADGALTFLGLVSVASLAISIFFLILGVIQGFLRFR